MRDGEFAPRDEKARFARRTILDLVSRDLPSRQLLTEVMARLRRVVRFDDGAWWTTDPESLLPAELWNFDNDVISREFSPETGVRLEDDHIGADERRLDLRVIARAGDAAVGAACFTRGKGAAPFTREEILYTQAIARDVGTGLRRELLKVATAGATAPPHSRGTLILGDNDVVEGFTPEAQFWLGHFGVKNLAEPLPPALRWISRQARAKSTSHGRSSALRPACSRLATDSGELIAVGAETLHGLGGTKIAMSVEFATPQSLSPLLMTLYDLTPREKTVAHLVIAGWPLGEVGVHLSLSLYTVRDHVKAIYAKVGVRSRPELTARIGGVPVGVADVA